MIKITSDDQGLVDRWLDRWMAEFETNPQVTTLMRRLGNEFPDEFVISALRYLDSKCESGSHRFLAALVLRQPAIFDHLSDPALRSREQATKLLRRFLAIDPYFDMHLARRLPDRTGENHSTALDSVRATRTLDILDQTSRGRRLLPILGHLPNCADPWISARAVLFISRRVQSPEWAEKQLQSPVPRARANAIEGIWGLNSPRAMGLLEKCAGDAQNRVAGNSLVGLALGGRAGVNQDVVLLSVGTQPVFRATAAWIMGKLADSEFLEPLQRLVRDDSPMVKGAALRATLCIRRLKPQPAVEYPAEMVEAPIVVETPEPLVPVFNLRLDGSLHSSTPRPGIFEAIGQPD